MGSNRVPATPRCGPFLTLSIPQTCRGSAGAVSDFVFGFTADPGDNLLEIIRKSRVASQARVDAARQVGDTVAQLRPSMGASSCSAISQCWRQSQAAAPRAMCGSPQRAEPNGPGRSDHKPPQDGLRISCGQLTSTRKRWIRQDRPGQLPQPSDEPLRAQHPATEGRRNGEEEDSSASPPQSAGRHALNRFHRARHARPTAGPRGPPRAGGGTAWHSPG